MDKQKIYFPNLNGIRFIAAFFVIIHHIEQFKYSYNIENNFKKNPFIINSGILGVLLFFVLSGFLITYLLLAEENQTKTISIKKFYIRRMLRIWPLYFFIIFLAFVVFPNIDSFILNGIGKDKIYTHLTLKLILYVLFLPNLISSFLGFVPYASHTWSIGTEEQFYLVWPILLKKIKTNRILLMIIIIITYVIINYLLYSNLSHLLPAKFLPGMRGFWSAFSIDSMAIGGIFAVLLFKKSKLLKLVMNTTLFYVSIIGCALMIINQVSVPYLQYEIYSILFGIIILNFAANDRIKLSLENPILNYLGNISYGLYMYHPICVVSAIIICKHFDKTSNWVIYPLSISLTIIIAGLSYKYFESYFLKFKHKFSNIISGNKS